MQKLTIVKIGGAILDHPQHLDQLLRDFASISNPRILVHGGGAQASDYLRKMQITPQMIDGRRITDAESLKVVQMVYAGLINKNVVAELQTLGCLALGMSGADADSIRAVKRPVGKIDYGFAGDIEKINSRAIYALLNAGMTPVFCALTHDGNGRMLNTNADTIASELAIALAGKFNVQLNYCSELPGVMNATTAISKITEKKYTELKTQNIISGGMIPKLDTAFAALQRGVNTIRIGDRTLLQNENHGTKISLEGSGGNR